MDMPTHTLAAPTTLGAPLPRTAGHRLARLAQTSHARRAVFFAALLVAWELLSRIGPWPDYLMPGPDRRRQGDPRPACATACSCAAPGSA